VAPPSRKAGYPNKEYNIAKRYWVNIYDKHTNNRKMGK
jgi:hypothetical protein